MNVFPRYIYVNKIYYDAAGKQMTNFTKFFVYHEEYKNYLKEIEMEVKNSYGYAPQFDIQDLNPLDISMEYINTHLKFGEYMDLVNWWKNNNS